MIADLIRALFLTSLAWTLAAGATAASPTLLPCAPVNSVASVVLGGNDICVAPTAISGSGNFNFNTTLATTGLEGQNEVLCYSFGGTGIDNDVWFSWTADFTGTALFTTCLNTTLNTKLAVYPGGGCPADGTSLGCNDDDCGFQSSVTFSASLGTAYVLQVGGIPGTVGAVGSFDIGPATIAANGTNTYKVNGASTGASWCLRATNCSTTLTSAILSLPVAAPAPSFAALIVSEINAMNPFGTCTVTATQGVSPNDDTFTLAYTGTFVLEVGDTSCTTFCTPTLTSSCIFNPILELVTHDSLEPGQASCFCANALTPCGNPGVVLTGCGNSTGSGAALTATGSDSILAADLVLSAANALPGQPGLFFQGTLALGGGKGVIFGDGLRCVGGSVTRLEVVVPDALGTALSTINVAALGGVSSGDSLGYQYWYRDPSGPCTSGFNLTNAYSVSWLP